MTILGRHISNWWFLLALPLSLAAAPFLGLTLIILGHLGGAIIGPPAIWDKTWRKPEREELIGMYIESGHRTLNQTEFAPAELNLAEDGSMSVEGLPHDPFELSETSCSLNGSGSWTGPDDDERITLDVTSNGATGSCKSSSYTLLEVTGHSKPHDLYWTIGDPDSGTGVWLKKGK